MKLPVGYVEGVGPVKASGFGGLGERLLRGMGWERGSGLGKSRQGMKEALDVKQKDDTLGVGANSTWDWQDKWWEKAFDSVAQSINAGDSESSDDSSSSDDDEINVSSRIKSNRDGTLSSASTDELRLLSSLSKQGGRLAAGRFGGRDAKMARIREQEAKMAAEAASKLGIDFPTSDTSDSTTTRTTTGSKKSKCMSEGLSALEPGSHGQKCEESSAERQIKRPRIVVEPKIDDSDFEKNLEALKPTPSHGWWGASIFVSAGCYESLKKINRQKRGFDESDQTNIFAAAHKGKSQGKVGLGQGRGAIRVGGVAFCGKRVTFEEDDTKNIDTRLPNSNSTTLLSNMTDAIENEEKNLKWEKIIVKALKKSPSGELNKKLLRKEVLKIAQKRYSTECIDKLTVKTAIKRTLKNNSKGRFDVLDKTIRLN